MIQGLFTAISGIRSGIARFDTIASNLSNLTTHGFRSRSLNFQTGAGGQGVVVASTTLNTSQGPFSLTSGTFDIAIDGDSFFEVQTASGAPLFTRAGSFQLDSEGFLVTADGSRVSPGIQIPAGAREVAISRSGEISALVDGELQDLGSLTSIRFNNPAGLESVGGGLFRATGSSGDPVTGDFSQPGFGRLTPGALEGSNVDLAGGLVDLLLTQRFIQAQTALIRVADEVLEEIVNLDRTRE